MTIDFRLQEPWHKASRWLNWSEHDEGYGVADYLVEPKGGRSKDFILEYNGNLYSKPRKELRQALKKKWVYQANSVRLVLTPSKSWTLLGNRAEIEAKEQEQRLRTAAGY